MSAIPDELRLAYLLLLTAVVFGCAAWFARRVMGGDWVETLLDSLLITFVVQYLAVALPGILGALSVWSMAVTAVLACGLLGVIARERSRPGSLASEREVEWGAGFLAVFAVSYVATVIWQQRILPPVANDSLTYHLPAAVQWIQRGRLDLYETWYHNPANTYSPLAGSVLAAWWLAPLGNDVLGRFVQAPGLILLFVAMVQIVRALGVSTTFGALIATGAIASRPFISQATIAKDDLFVAAFFAAAVAGLTRVKLTDTLGPWRVGLALGMLLATKFTALLCIPILLLAVDAPVRAGWKLRHWIIAIVCALALAGPWYARNALLTGNPLYPIVLPGLNGMFETLRSEQLGSAEALGKTFVTGYFSLTWPLAIVLALVWLGAAGLASRQLLRNPLVRICLLGPPLGVGLFLIASPYAEIRFIYPSLVLMFACSGLVAYRIKESLARLTVGVVVMLVGVGTGFVPPLLKIALPPAIVVGVALFLLIWGVGRLDPPQFRRAVTIWTAAGIAVIGCLIYIYYGAYVRRPVTGYAASCIPCWKNPLYGYGELVEAWEYIRTKVPPGSTIAYANTHYTYSLYGFGLTNKIIHIPTRRHMRHLHDLPRFEVPLAGEQIGDAIAEALAKNPDPEVWLQNLSESGAQYLLVVKDGPQSNPPELTFAAANSARFHPIFENKSAVVYRVEP